MNEMMDHRSKQQQQRSLSDNPASTTTGANDHRSRSSSWFVSLFDLVGIFDRQSLVRLSEQAGYVPSTDTTPAAMVDALVSPHAWRYPYQLKSVKTRMRTEALVPQINISATTSHNARYFIRPYRPTM
jgi:hypothetical protein